MPLPNPDAQALGYRDNAQRQAIIDSGVITETQLASIEARNDFSTLSIATFAFLAQLTKNTTTTS